MTRPSTHLLTFACCAAALLAAFAEEAVKPADKHYQQVPKEQSPAPPPPEVAGTVAIDFRGAKALAPADLKTAIAEQIKEIEDKGLTKARDDAAFSGQYIAATAMRAPKWA